MSLVQRKTDVAYVFTAPTPPLADLPAGYERVRLDHTLVRYFFDRPDVDPWRLRSYPPLLDRGCHGFLVHKGSEWAAVQWMATPDSAEPPHLPARVASGLYWGFYGHTREEHRRLGLWRALKSTVVQHVRQLSGDSTGPVYSDTGVENAASRRAHEEFGYVPAGVIHRLNVRVPKLTTLKRGSWDHAATHPPIPLEDGGK